MGLDKKRLRKSIILILRKQGYKINKGLIELPKNLTKDDLRRMNSIAVKYRIKKAEPHLKRWEPTLLRYIADGREIIPSKINPKLVSVDHGTENELLFRYASLNWSIPVSSGYGRRLRFLIVDESNGKLIGLLGLGDPVYSIKNRDEFIGWDSETKKKNLYHVMDAYLLGAVPPYTYLLCGKLVALLALSNEVRSVFCQKYANNKTTISRQVKQPWLVLITTTSALGRASIYNRIKLNGYEFWRRIGFTQGSGEFHFSNGVYEQLRLYAESNCKPTAKKDAWGKGFRSRRELIKKCLPMIGLSAKLLYHGIHREIFVASLAHNTIDFLRGKVSAPDFYDWPANKLAGKFLDRWLLPRAARNAEYQSFKRENFQIWRN